MATTNNFQNMLNEYLPNTMFMQEYVKRDWLLSNCEIDNGWKGGTLVVPFRGARPSSVEFGQLAGSSDIAQSQFVRGQITGYKESWASMILYHRDLMDHNGKIPETTFLKLIPDESEKLMAVMKSAVSTQLINGPHFATFTADGSAGGVIEVDHIDRFELGQKVEIDDDNSVPATVYVIAINVNQTQNTGAITVSASRGGAALDVSAYTVAQNAKAYHPGVITNGAFQSLRSALLSLANGGSATLHGQTKLAYPYLQAVNATSAFGNSITATNILDKLFDFYTVVKNKGRGTASTIVLSYKHLGNIMKLIETQKGPYVVTKAPSTSLYDWTEIEITSVRGALKIVGILEADDDVIQYLDMKAFKFYTNGGFKKRMAPDGKEYFEIRATSGYAYVLDFSLFGELAIENPSGCGIIPGVTYA